MCVCTIYVYTEYIFLILLFHTTHFSVLFSFEEHIARDYFKRQRKTIYAHTVGTIVCVCRMSSRQFAPEVGGGHDSDFVGFRVDGLASGEFAITPLIVAISRTRTQPNAHG